MTIEPANGFASGLLIPRPFSSGFKRENPTAFRYMPYSRKAKRTLDIYTNSNYDLWIHCEWNFEILQINERPAEIQYPGESAGDCKALLKVEPAMVTVDAEEKVTVHLIHPSLQVENTPGIEEFNNVINWLQLYLNKFSVGLIVWTAEELRRNPIELENWQELLNYTMRPDLIVPPALRDQILLVVKRSRTTTIGALLDDLSGEDPDWLMRALSDLLQQRLLKSDIAQHLLGYATELSVYHDFPKTNS